MRALEYLIVGRDARGERHEVGAEDVAVSVGQPAMWLGCSEKKRFESLCGPAAACEREGGGRSESVGGCGDVTLSTDRGVL